MSVILQYFFIGTLCHQGAFTFLKSTLNSASFDWVVKNNFRPLLGALPKTNSDLKQNFFLPVFGNFI
jgi:hypothetical protein